MVSERLTNRIDLATHSAVITAGCPPASLTCKHVLPFIATHSPPPPLELIIFSYFLYDYIDIFRGLAHTSVHTGGVIALRSNTCTLVAPLPDG